MIKISFVLLARQLSNNAVIKSVSKDTCRTKKVRMRKLVLLIVAIAGLTFTTGGVAPEIKRSLVFPDKKAQEWEVLIQALIMVESGGNPSALGNAGEVGILQLMPVYVVECNRLSGKEYTLEDRYCPEKSIEMFNIIQEHYNPGRSIETAIKMHNPGAGDWYRNKVHAQLESMQPIQS